MSRIGGSTRLFACRFSGQHAPHSFLPASFSATQSSIRSSTARLAELDHTRDQHHQSTQSTHSSGLSLSKPRSFSFSRSDTRRPNSSTLPTLPPHPASTGQLSTLASLPGSASTSPPDSEVDRQKSGAGDFRSTTTPIGIQSNILPSSPPGSDEYSSSITPRATPRKLQPSSSFGSKSHPSPLLEARSPGPSPSQVHQVHEDELSDEQTPLLARNPTPLSIRSSRLSIRSLKVQRPTAKQVYAQAVVAPIKAVPAVCLGLLLNVLDGVSCE